MRVLSQRLRHRVDLQELVVTQDASTGAQEEAWSSILGAQAGQLPAEIVPLSGREFVAAKAMQNASSARITIRWRDDVTPTMRVVHQGRAYGIVAVLADPSLRRHLTLLVEEGAVAELEPAP